MNVDKKDPPKEEEKLEQVIINQNLTNLNFQYVERMSHEVQSLTNEQIRNKIRALESETLSMKSEMRTLREKMSKFII